MGLFDRILPLAGAVNLALADPPILSPWASTQLSKVVLSELAGVQTNVVNRATLMRIPPVARGRGLVCGTLSRYPLSLWKYDDPATKLPPPVWMTSTSTGQSPLLRMLWTLDDLIFSGLSVWATKRVDGALVDAIRVPPARWNIAPSGNGILVDGDLAKADEVIIFEGPQEGLVTIAEDSAKGSRDLSNAWRQRVAAPVPIMVVRQTDPNAPLNDTEVDKVIKDVEAARAKSGTVFVPDGYEIDAPGNGQAPDLYVQGRNADRLDWANYFQLPASMMDGSTSTASLTYSTAEGKRSEFVDYSLAYWAMPIEARLSQDDVTAAGEFSRFDLSWLTTPNQQGTNPASED